MTTLIQRLRTQAQTLRRKPTPLVDLIPMLTEAADALEQAIADEKEKQSPTRNCKTCKFYAVSCHLYEPCLRCTHQTGISDHWEPKP